MKPARHQLRRRLALTPKEKVFCAAYLQCLQGAEAVRMAGIPSAEPALTASRMLRKPRVRRYLDAHLAKRVAGKQELLGELTEIATAPWRDFITIKRDEDGNEVEVRLNLREKVSATKLLLQAQGHMRDRLAIEVEHRLVRALRQDERPVRVLDPAGEGRLALPAGPSDVLLRADTIDAELVERETAKVGKAKREGKAGKASPPK